MPARRELPDNASFLQRQEGDGVAWSGGNRGQTFLRILPTMACTSPGGLEVRLDNLFLPIHQKVLSGEEPMDLDSNASLQFGASWALAQTGGISETTSEPAGIWKFLD